MSHKFITISSNNTQVLDPLPKGLWIGSGGNVSIKDTTGNTFVFANVANGTFLDIRPSIILTTTTANDIIGYL